MTATSWGPKNEPEFADGDAPDVALNPKQAAAYAGKVGNRRVGTTAERNAAAGNDLWVGLLWGDTTIDAEYKYTDTGWKRISSRTIAFAASTNVNGIIYLTHGFGSVPAWAH